MKIDTHTLNFTWGTIMFTRGGNVLCGDLACALFDCGAYYGNPANTDIDAWRGCVDEGALYLPFAGEILFRKIY